LQPETDSNLVDVYVNYLRKKVDPPNESKVIHTVRGLGYRLGRPAPDHASLGLAKLHQTENQEGNHNHHESAVAGLSDLMSAQNAPLRAVIHSTAHDLAQPLTSIRCFLEVLAMHNGASIPPADLKSIEQQADRAISLAKSISALVRESPVPTGPWVSLDGLLNDLFSDFTVLLYSGLLTLDRRWNAAIQVTSSPVLRQLMVLFLSKLIGRNTRPLALTISAKTADGRCLLDLSWTPADDSGSPALEAKNILARELTYIQELVYSLGGEIVLPEGRSEIQLKVPAAPPQSIRHDMDLSA
jgi:hypothetical protein